MLKFLKLALFISISLSLSITLRYYVTPSFSLFTQIFASPFSIFGRLKQFGTIFVQGYTDVCSIDWSVNDVNNIWMIETTKQTQINPLLLCAVESYATKLRNKCVRLVLLDHESEIDLIKKNNRDFFKQLPNAEVVKIDPVQLFRGILFRF